MQVKRQKRQADQQEIAMNEVIEKTLTYVKERLGSEVTGHDWHHTYRVWKMALRIAEQEGSVDLFIIQLASLLHDIADWKFHSSDYPAGPVIVRDLLKSLSVDEDNILHVCEIIKDLSFKGAGVKSEMKTKEGMIVQDADRLDALGAIGIARCFATGARLKRMIHDPGIKPRLHKSFDEYKKPTTSINHFYEKLLLLKDLMNTETANKIAEKRHEFMKQYLKEFLDEWDGKN